MSDPTATAIKRQFKYNGQVIITPEQDPGPEFSPKDILEHLKSTNIFPELGKSEIEIRQTNLKDGTVQFEFVKKAGTKGAIVKGLYHPARVTRQPEMSLKMARADDNDLKAMLDFMLELDEAWDDYDSKLVSVIERHYDNVSMSWRRVVEGYPILRDTCTDPALGYLEWRPEIIALSDAYAALLKAARNALKLLQDNNDPAAAFTIDQLQHAIDLAGPEFQPQAEQVAE